MNPSLLTSSNRLSGSVNYTAAAQVSITSNNLSDNKVHGAYHLGSFFTAVHSWKRLYCIYSRDTSYLKCECWHLLTKKPLELDLDVFSSMSDHQDRRAFQEIRSNEDEASREERGPICSGILDTRNSGLLNNQPIKVSIRSHTHTPDTIARRGRCRSFPTKLETRCDETPEHKSQTSQRAKERVSKFARFWSRLAEERNQ